MLPVDHLIEPFWAGKATASEKEQLYRYVHTHRPEPSFDDFELFLDNVNPEQAETATVNEHAHQLLNSIKQKANIPVAEFRKTRNFNRAGLAIAACILVAAFISLPWLLQRNNILQSDPKQLAKVSDAPLPVSKYIINKSNTILDTVLPDRSKVSLFPNSSIAFADGFEQHARRLSMQGKARFHVTKDKTRAFQVWAGGLITTAIGTVFEINTLDRDQTNVKLIEGKISVKKATQHRVDSVILLAGQSLVYLVQQNQIKLGNNVKTQPATDQGPELVFNNLSLAHVFKQLEMEYGIVIEYEAPSPDVLFSARFGKQVGPDKIISEIVKQNKLTMRQSGGVYSIK